MKRQGKKITLGADACFRKSIHPGTARSRRCAAYLEGRKGQTGEELPDQERRNDKRRAISQRKRKLIERVFGTNQSDRPLRQIKLRGLKRVDWFYQLTIAAYNLTRISLLVPPSSMAT